MKKISQYLPVFSLGIKDSLVFRSNTMITLLSQLANLCVSLWMWSILLPHDDFNGVAKYLVITNTTALVFTTAPLYFLARLIRSGQLSIYLVRPVSIYWYVFTYNLGAQAPLLLFYLLLIVLLPNRFSITISLMGYLILCAFMFFNLMMTLGTLGFWLVNMWPLRSGINAIYLLFGGLYFPLTMLGKNISGWLQYNPFSLVTDVPARIISTQSTADMATYFVSVLAWLLVFMALQKYLFMKGMKKYEGVGA